MVLATSLTFYPVFNLSSNTIYPILVTTKPALTVFPTTGTFDAILFTTNPTAVLSVLISASFANSLAFSYLSKFANWFPKEFPIKLAKLETY